MSEPRNALGPFKEVRDRLTVILSELAVIADERDMEVVVRQNQIETRRKLADLLRERAGNVQKKETFKLAVVGEFNAGKSTLINALLEREILSISWKPTTASKTLLKYGEPERFRVAFLPQMKLPPVIQESDNLADDLARYTSDPSIADDEARLRGTTQSLAEQIKEVEVWCLANFLKDRELEIIDTPGLGSVFEAHKDVTYGLIPEVDATMFLFPIDPGVGEEEIFFLRFVREHVSRMFFVMTKSDYAKTKVEREERAAFNRTTIEIKSGVKVDHIYPVSAKLQLEGHVDETGFPEVVEDLMKFLVSSSGVARLEAPLEYSHDKWRILSESISNEFNDADKNLQTLKEELRHYTNEQSSIKAAKNEMLDYIDLSVESMIASAVDGIDSLPFAVQMKVENAINSYNLKELKAADKNVQIIIKEASLEWLSGKQKRFDTSVQHLQLRITRDLRKIVEDLDSVPTTSSGEREIDIAGHFANRIFGQAALRLSAGTVMRAGTAGAVGGGVILGLLLTGMVLPVILIVGVPIAATFGILGVDLFGMQNRLRNQLIKQLREKLPPPNTNNIYEALVYGGFVNGIEKPGLKEAVRKAFNEWGNELKESVDETVVNLVDSRITQLDRLIREKESGKWDRERNLQRLQQQQEVLTGIEKRLTEISIVVSALSQRQFDIHEVSGDLTV